MDPITHLILPLLILLAAKQNPRIAVPLAFFAMFPDLDSIFTPHRGVLHNLFVVLVMPLAFIVYARFKKPVLLLPGLMVLFYLLSHVMLDITGGVALLYPFFAGAFYVEPQLLFETADGLGFRFNLDIGITDLVRSDEYIFIGDLSFGFALLIALFGIVFRKEMALWVRNRIGDVRWAIGLVRNKISGR